MAGQRIALALGSGGARGYAHLGVVQEIRARGHEVVGIAGTSMGALVGGLLAAGHEEAFTTWATSLTQRDVLRMVDPKLRAGGATSPDRMIAKVDQLVGELDIESLAIPFTAVATDLDARREVWFQRGPLSRAIRASIAIPGLFRPSVIDGRVLVDGGLMNPLPIEPTAAANADATVAVSLQGPRSLREGRTPSRESASVVSRAEWADGLLKRFGRSAQPEEAHDAQRAADLRIAEVVSLSFDAMQGIISRYRLAGQPPDVLVTVPLSAARTLDFHRAGELIELGRTLGAKALDEAGL